MTLKKHNNSILSQHSTLPGSQRRAKVIGASHNNQIKHFFIKSTAALIILFAVLIAFAGNAYAFFSGGPPMPPMSANTLGDAIGNIVRASYSLPGLISGSAYLLGLLLGFMGIIKVKEHVENPQQTTISEPIKRFVAGGALFALPTIVRSAHTAIVGGGLFGGAFSIPGLGELRLTAETGFTGSTSGTFGLDSMIVSLMSDIWRPMHGVINAFAYMAGLVFVFIAITRLLKSTQEGPRGPGGIGTIMTIIIAGVLLSLNQVMGAFSQSMFGTTTITNGVTFGGTGLGSVLDPTEIDHVSAVISGVLAFMKVVGWISFVRGFMLLRDFADSGGQSQQASMMASMTHIFGGALLVQLGPLLNVVQETLGITAFGAIFT